MTLNTTMRNYPK